MGAAAGRLSVRDRVFLELLSSAAVVTCQDAAERVSSVLEKPMNGGRQLCNRQQDANSDHGHQDAVFGLGCTAVVCNESGDRVRHEFRFHSCILIGDDVAPLKLQISFRTK